MPLRLTLAVAAVSAVTLAAPPPLGGKPEVAPPSPTTGTPPPPNFALKPAVKGQAPASSYTKEQVARGAYLVRAGGCQDCHTPKVFDAKAGLPVPDLQRMLAGHPEGGPEPLSTLVTGDTMVVGPTFTSFTTGFGTAYAANLTPDLETGSGAWTEETFLRIARTGKHLGNGRPILPPMPWPSLTKLTDDDLRAVFAYLRSVPPVKNRVPDPKVIPSALDTVAKLNAAMLRAP